MPKAAQKRPQPKRAHRPIRRPAPKSAIVLRTPEVPEHRYALNREQVELIKRTIAKGATDDELQLFLHVAKRHRLDPFTRQLHLIKRKNTESGEMVATIQIGIDGYRQMASRYTDFGSISEAEYGPTIKDEKRDVPEWARVKVYKKGLSEPSVGVAYWHEYSPDLTRPQAFMWRQMPKHMLAKCAEALALRKAHPDLADVYTSEEMSRANQDITPEGRMMTVTNPAEEKYKEREKEGLEQLTPAQREVVERRMKEAEARKNAPIDIQPPRESAPEMKPCLFWQHHKESDSWEIFGSDELKKQNRDLLAPLYSPVAKAIVCSAKQLGALINQLEMRHVSIREYGAQREPGE